MARRKGDDGPSLFGADDAPGVGAYGQPAGRRRREGGSIVGIPGFHVAAPPSRCLMCGDGRPMPGRDRDARRVIYSCDSCGAIHVVAAADLDAQSPPQGRPGAPA